MENNNAKTITAVLAGLMVLFLVGGIYYWNQSRSLTTQNDRIEQRADSLMSVKIRLEGDVQNLQDQLGAATTQQADLTRQLADVNGLLTARERTLDQLRRTKAGEQRTIRRLNADMASLTRDRDSLTNQMDAVVQKIDLLNEQNDQLNTQNNELAPLRQQLAAMSEELKTKVSRQALTGDAFRVETRKKNDKETAKAKKVDEVTISLSVPAELGLTGTEEVYLSLTDEQHNAMMPALSTNTVMVGGASESIPVHASQAVNFGQNPQRISFTITPATNVKPGVYRASVYTKDRYLGATEFGLRDSFWFF